MRLTMKQRRALTAVTVQRYGHGSKKVKRLFKKNLRTNWDLINFQFSISYSKIPYIRWMVAGVRPVTFEAERLAPTLKGRCKPAFRLFTFLPSLLSSIFRRAAQGSVRVDVEHRRRMTQGAIRKAQELIQRSRIRTLLSDTRNSKFHSAEVTMNWSWSIGS